MIGEEVVIKATNRSRESGVPVGGFEGAAVGAKAKFRHAGGAVTGEELHHAGHRVGAVKRTFGPADKLNVIDFGHGQNAEIEGPTGIVYGYAVEDDLVVARFAAAHEEGSETTTFSGIRDYRAGQKADSVTSRDRLQIRQFRRAQ